MSSINKWPRLTTLLVLVYTPRREGRKRKCWCKMYVYLTNLLKENWLYMIKLSRNFKKKKKKSYKYFGTYVLTSELRTCMLWLFCSVGGTTWGKKKKKDQLMSSPNKRRRHQDQNPSHLFQAYILRCNLKTSLLLNNWWLCFLIKFITVCCHSDT